MWKSGMSSPWSANPMPANDGRSMGVRSTSGEESTDDTEDSDAVRRVGVRGPDPRDASCPNKSAYFRIVEFFGVWKEKG
jgi:hypothetical protein